MTPGEVRSVLVLAPGELGDRLLGPEIRAWEFAKALSREYQVTVAANRADDYERAGVRVIASSRRRLASEAARHDALLSACLPPYLLALHAPRVMTISDLYDPHEWELAVLTDDRKRERGLRVQAAIQEFQLRHADLILCASERQRAELQRSVTETLEPGDSGPDPIVVPFGIPDPPPRSARRPLREHFPQIQAGDTLVLWWGSVWRWLDAETAVRAFARIAASRSDVKLVITAGRTPNANVGRVFDATDEARTLAEELGVLNRTVLFYDEWIPYDERHDYLREADLGLTLHRRADEARLAARARYMDYLSAELPCVLGRGDETAESFGEAGFATLVERPDAESLAATLLSLIDDPQALAAARAAGHTLAAESHWSAVGAKLRATLASAAELAPRPKRASLMRDAALLRDAGAYYAHRMMDRLTPGG